MPWLTDHTPACATKTLPENSCSVQAYWLSWGLSRLRPSIPGKYIAEHDKRPGRNRTAQQYYYTTIIQPASSIFSSSMAVTGIFCFTATSYRAEPVKSATRKETGKLYRFRDKLNSAPYFLSSEYFLLTPGALLNLTDKYKRLRQLVWRPFTKKKKKQKTGIIGPSGHFYRLVFLRSINFFIC
ncbi:predicted protein [Methanosarcina acetivorans C2A]|uniref:Uncharacterized protein n=1 Tax=Methanosarcina acetivorans (strain ATCC 35395 / DSM 2834 / JCM 12185 / C2A) TaxID=188937 RepID=Q8TPK3_METAC|nr:predicted protein [Methanosarcina acetivorans C2A]